MVCQDFLRNREAGRPGLVDDAPVQARWGVGVLEDSAQASQDHRRSLVARPQLLGHLGGAECAGHFTLVLQEGGRARGPVGGSGSM